MKIDEKSKDLLKDVLAQASDGRKERIGLLIDNADVSDDVKAEFKSLVDEAASKKDIPKDILDALKVEGMDDYIKSLMDETKQEAINETNKETEEKNSDIQEVLIDSIVSNSVALFKKEINMEDIDGSKDELKKSLSEKNNDELKELSKELHKEVQDALSNQPTEKLDSETISEDPQENEEKDMSDSEKILNSYFK